MVNESISCNRQNTNASLLPHDATFFGPCSAGSAGCIRAQQEEPSAKTVRYIDTGSTTVNIVMAVKKDLPFLKFFNKNSVPGATVRLDGACWNL